MATTEIDRPVLFATDFGEGSRKALPYAISYANQHQTRLILLHMLPIVPRVEDIGWLTPDHVTRIQEEEQSIARQRLKELIRHSDTRLGVDTIFMPRFGDPAEGIIKTAESFHAEVIVMGLNSAVNADVISHLQRSIAYKVACQAGCAVLTVSG